MTRVCGTVLVVEFWMSEGEIMNIEFKPRAYVGETERWKVTVNPGAEWPVMLEAQDGSEGFSLKETQLRELAELLPAIVALLNGGIPGTGLDPREVDGLSKDVLRTLGTGTAVRDRERRKWVRVSTGWMNNSGAVHSTETLCSLHLGPFTYDTSPEEVK
jgi:hypothetical protein